MLMCPSPPQPPDPTPGSGVPQRQKGKMKPAPDPDTHTHAVLGWPQSSQTQAQRPLSRTSSLPVSDKEASSFLGNPQQRGCHSPSQSLA